MEFEIDGRKYRLLRDYDKGSYHYLTFQGKVTYLAKRVDFILINPCRTAIAEAAVEENNLGLILATAICAGISAASTFLHGKDSRGNDRKFFVAFAEKYMPELKEGVSSLRARRIEWVYDDIRCGLAHAFTIHNGGIENRPNYVDETEFGPQIGLRMLLEDFARGWAQYLSDVSADRECGHLGALFKQRFDSIFRDT